MFKQFNPRQRRHECPSCLSPISFTDNFCPHCKESIKQHSSYELTPLTNSVSTGFTTIRLYNSLCCNKSVQKGDKFCWKCGDEFTHNDVNTMIESEGNSVKKALIISFIIIVLFVAVFSQ